MTKEEALKILDTIHTIGEQIDALEMAIEALENSPSAQPELKWIPCSERLPEKRRETYWVCTDAGSQHECRWTNNVFGIGKSDEWGWSIFDTHQYTKVLAWMPLPEPYYGDAERRTDERSD